MTQRDLLLRALAEAETETETALRDHGRVELIRRLGAAGHLDDAVQVAHRTENAYRGAVGLLLAAFDRRGEGDSDSARRYVSEALALARDRIVASDSAYLMNNVVAGAIVQLARLDDLEEAERLAAAHPRCLLDEADACAALAMAHARRDDLASALAAASRVAEGSSHEDDVARWFTLSKAAEGLMAEARVDAGRELARAIGDPAWRGNVLAHDPASAGSSSAWRDDPRAVAAEPYLLAHGVFGDLTSALGRALAASEIAALREIAARLAPLPAPGRRRFDLSDYDIKDLLAQSLARAQSAAGDFEGAWESALISVDRSWDQIAETVAWLAAAQAAAGQIDEAQHRAERLERGLWRAFALASIAAAMPR